jgi:DNA-binding response OmpR family regulator
VFRFLRKKEVVVEGKILVIDDEESLRSLMSTYLGKKGYTVVTAKDGKEGLKTALRLIPDLILLDITMPKMDGFAVLQKLKDDQKTMSIPVVMLTGRGDDESKLKAVGLYSDYYITKPFDLEELHAKIRKILSATA